MKLPSFFDIDLDYLAEIRLIYSKYSSEALELINALGKLDLNSRENCACIKFRKALKYMMKGFYDKANVERELHRALEIEANLIVKIGFNCYCIICSDNWNLQSIDENNNLTHHFFNDSDLIDPYYGPSNSDLEIYSEYQYNKYDRHEIRKS